MAYRVWLFICCWLILASVLIGDCRGWRDQNHFYFIFLISSSALLVRRVFQLNRYFTCLCPVQQAPIDPLLEYTH